MQRGRASGFCSTRTDPDAREFNCIDPAITWNLSQRASDKRRHIGIAGLRSSAVSNRFFVEKERANDEFANLLRDQRLMPTTFRNMYSIETR